MRSHKQSPIPADVFCILDGTAARAILQQPAEQAREFRRKIKVGQRGEPARSFESPVSLERTVQRARPRERKNRLMLENHCIGPRGERFYGEIVSGEVVAFVAVRALNALEPFHHTRRRRNGSVHDGWRHGTTCTACVLAMSFDDLFWLSSSEITEMVSSV